MGCQWTFKNAEGGGVIVSSDSFGRWTQQSFYFHPYQVREAAASEAREAAKQVIIPAGSRACGSALAPAGEVPLTDKQLKEFRERGGDMIFCTI